MIKLNGGGVGGKGRSILSFDHGGPRGISQLLILNEIVNRIYNEKERELGLGIEATPPCEHFDLIGGSGMGGFIAILLVVFGLQVEDALEHFATWNKEVFDESLTYSCTERMKRMKEKVDSLLQQSGFEPNTKLNEPNERDKGCKLVVVVREARNLGSIVHLRNHPSSSGNMSDITIRDAILATCSSPFLFPAAKIKESAWSREFISAEQGLANPTREIIKVAHEIFKGDISVSCVLSIGAGHPGVIRLWNDDGDSQPDRAMRRLVEDCEQVAREVGERMRDTQAYFRLSVEQGMQVSDRRASQLRKEGPEHLTGDFVAHTLAYLDQEEVRKVIDNYIKALLTKEEVVTLAQLNHSGGGRVLLRNLPPLVSRFVEREAPWKRMLDVFFAGRDSIPLHRQFIMVIRGMGGLGKTQLALRFAREFGSQFSSVAFIDCSSVERLKSDLLRHVRAITKSIGIDLKRALEILGAENRPSSYDVTKKVPWLLIYDNCDDDTLNLASYIPNCNHGCILVTTRLRSFQQLDLDTTLDLQTMSPDEAVETLKIYSGQATSHPRASIVASDEDEASMRSVARKLGYLPLALVQAGSHVHATGESWVDYDRTLQRRIHQLMSRPPTSQRNGNNVSTFSAFDASYDRLSPHARQFLSLFSFFHSSPFPLEIIGLAAQHLFSGQYYDYLIPRSKDYVSSLGLLKSVFCPTDHWDPVVFNETVGVLRNYSLISIQRSRGVTMVYMHPLIQAWVRRTKSEEYPRKVYEEATIRILASAACQDNWIINQALVSHLVRTKIGWQGLHVNDKAAFAAIFHKAGEYDGSLKLRASTSLEVRAYHAKTLQNVTDLVIKSFNECAESYKKLRRFPDAVKAYLEVYKACRKSFGELEAPTLAAVNNLADVFSEYANAHGAEICLRVLRDIRRALVHDPAFGPEHETTKDTEARLALVLYRQGQYVEAEHIQESVVAKRKRDLGKYHGDTIDAYETMGRIYTALEKHHQAESLQRGVLEWREKNRGPDHRETVKARSCLAITLHKMQSFAEARDLFERALDSQRRTIGDNDIETAQTKMNMAFTLFHFRQSKEALTLAKEGRDGIGEVLGKEHQMYKNADAILKKVRRVCARYGDEQPVTAIADDGSPTPNGIDFTI